MKILQEIKYDTGGYEKLYLYHHDNSFCKPHHLRKQDFICKHK